MTTPTDAVRDRRPGRAPALVAAALLLLTPALAAAQDFADAIAQARAQLASILERGPVPGISAAVAHDGEIAWSEGFGLADLELGVPVTTETKFRIASISKPVTAVAALVLAQEGLLDLDAPIQTYLPRYPRPEPMTCRQLAAHTAGIRHYRGAEIRSASRYPRLAAAFAIYAIDPPLFEPGADRSYSTYGYTTLGAAMEAAAGEEFVALLQSRVLGPLGMTHTVADDARAIVPGRAAPYSYDGGLPVNAPHTDHSYKTPGGGLLSTPEDLVRLASALFEPGLLSREWLDALFEPAVTADGVRHGYALGWDISPDATGRPTFGHSGGQPGARAWLVAWPEERLAVAVLCNIDGAPYGRREVERIAAPFLEAAAGVTP